MPLSGAESARNQILRQRILFPHLRKSKLFKFLTFRGKTVFSLKKRNRTGRSVDEKAAIYTALGSDTQQNAKIIASLIPFMDFLLRASELG
jgi:hypothetical protein